MARGSSSSTQAAVVRRFPNVKRHQTVEEFLAAQENWVPELRLLRKIPRSTDLEETVKWGGPCYTSEGKNVVGIGAFQSYPQGKGLNDKYRR